jgi:predicted dehydrogenase
MKFLVIGLGSMGKRRVRNLQTLGHTEIAGFDPRADRRLEAHEKYGIAVFDNFERALASHAPDALIISTSPESHMSYAFTGHEKKLPCFIEASVVDAARILELAKASEVSGVVMAPSCTMRYFPGPKLVKQLLTEGLIGRPINLNYHTGQYLPDWHPWEHIDDFYVSRRETGGGREIVPFELTWLDDIFGDAIPVACIKSKLTDMSADIDDLYHCLFRYPGNVLASVTVDVASRPNATRELRVLGTEGQLVMSGDEKCVRYATLKNPAWTRVDLAKGSVESGYINPEEPYIAELADFVSAAAKGKQSLFPNTLREDARILASLAQLEQLAEALP